MKNKTSSFEIIPAVHTILNLQSMKKLVSEFGHSIVSDVIREIQEDLRKNLFESAEPKNSTLIEKIFVHKVRDRVLEVGQRSIKPVLNLTGTILHTNMGRALLPKEAIEAVTEVASSTSNVEFDLDEGLRGYRDKHVEKDICNLIGCEAAAVVNNNAAAVMLVLNTLARRKEVLISRGELIEIGGSFRLPDIMKSAGCKLREVGTTNRTYIKDFENEISSKTGMIFKAYTSNYTINGFTKEVNEKGLVQLSKELNIPFVVDLGSGSLIQLKKNGIEIEATPSKKILSGVDLITFSGDKLIGGPQCGIIAGRRDLIKKINLSPMKRAMRCDKISIAALSAVLKLYRDPAKVINRIPTLRFIFRPQSEIRSLAKNILPFIKSYFNDHIEIKVIDCNSQVGSGSLPGKTLPSAGIRIEIMSNEPTGLKLNQLVKLFRSLPMPIIGRIHNDALIFDFRCLEDKSIFIKQLEFLPKTLWKNAL